LRWEAIYWREIVGKFLGKWRGGGGGVGYSAVNINSFNFLIDLILAVKMDQSL